MPTYIEDITRWREDMNFMFEWQEQYQYCSLYENIKFISSSQRVMFFLLYGDIEYFRFYCVVLSSQVLQIRLGFIKKGGKKRRES